MGKGSSPKMPDPWQLADAQVWGSQISQFTPDGNLVYGGVGPDGGFMPFSAAPGYSPAPSSSPPGIQMDGGAVPLSPYQGIDPRFKNPSYSGAMQTHMSGGYPMSGYSSGGAGGRLPRALQVQETPFQQTSRGNREAMALALQGDVMGGGALPSFWGVDQVRAALPDASRLAAGLPGSRSTAAIESVLPGLRDVGAIEGALPGVNRNFGRAISDATNATYRLGMNLMQPDMDLERRRLEQQLSDQGLPVGSEAHNSALDRFDRVQGSQRNNLALASVLAGQQEQDRLFGQQIRGRESEYGIQSGLFGLGSQARGQLFGEQTALKSLEEAERAARLNERLSMFNAALQKQSLLSGLSGQQRGQAFNERTALTGGAQIAPSLSMFQMPQPIDVAGFMQTNSALQNQARASSQASNAGLLGNLGMAAAMFL